MHSLNFKNKWENKRKKGIFLYLLEWAVLIPIGGIAGRVIGNYFANQTFDISISIKDIIVLIMLSFLGICLGLYSWINNEKKYSKQSNS